MTDRASLGQGSLRVELAGGVLEFHIGSREIVFVSEFGEEGVFRSHPLASEGVPRIVHLDVPEGALLADQFGRSLYFLSARNLDLRAIADFARDETDDLAFMSIDFVRTSEGILVVYENGLLYVDPTGRVRWHVRHGQYGYSFDRVEGRRAWYHDKDGNEFAYDLDTGSEILGENAHG